MSPQTQAKVYEPFFTTKGMGGTGLGLWISAGIIHGHHGRMLLKAASEMAGLGLCSFYSCLQDCNLGHCRNISITPPPLRQLGRPHHTGPSLVALPSYCAHGRGITLRQVVLQTLLLIGDQISRSGGRITDAL